MTRALGSGKIPSAHFAQGEWQWRSNKRSRTGHGRFVTSSTRGEGANIHPSKKPLGYFSHADPHSTPIEMQQWSRTPDWDAPLGYQERITTLADYA